MKRKFFSVLLALVLVLSFSLVTAVPAAAADSVYAGYTLGAVTGDTAEWSTVQEVSGDYSVKLTHSADASKRAYVKLYPTTGITLASFVAAPATYGFSYWRTEDKIGPQLELTFTDGANGWVELTVEVALYDYIDDDLTGQWISKTLSATEQCQFFGEDSNNAALTPPGLIDLSTLVTAIATAATADNATAVGAWEMTQAIVDCGWSGDTQTAYVDDVIIDGVTYDLEPVLLVDDDFTSATLGWGVARFATIQDGIDAFALGRVIVAAGTYVEVITVDTASLTLESVAGTTTTIIQGTIHLNATADDFVLGGATGKGFTLNTGGVLIDVNGPADVEISYNKFDTGGAPGRAIHFSAAGATGLTVTYNTFVLTDAYDQGVRNGYSGTGLVGLTVSNNTFTGTSNTLETSAIEIGALDMTTTASTFSGNAFTSVGNGVLIGSDSGGGAEFDAASGTLTISSNTFTTCDYGIDLVNATATSVDQDIVIKQNTFTSNNYGFAIDYGVYPATTDNWEPGDFTVKYNSFSGNTYAIYNNKTEAVTAEYNYWGRATGAYLAATNPGVSGYRGDAVTTYVDYAPWLYLTTAANSGDTVANIVTNEVPAYANSVVLSSGWNTFSAPIGLDGQYNTWAELYDLTSANYSLAYRFNPTTQEFESLATTDTDAVAPGESFYIKMNEAGSLPYCYSTVMTVPSRSLSADWNLVGGGMTTQDEIITCVSIATVGSTAGYTQIISPAENAASWIWTTGLGTQGDFVLGEGYWVFLPIARTLGLFDFTPVTWVALP